MFMAVRETKAWGGAWTGAFGIGLVLALIGLGWFVAGRVWPRDPLIEVVAMPAGGGGVAGSAAGGPVVVDEGPRFDVVRVGPQGAAVIAGRATPGTEVVVRSDGAEVARTRADAQGAFVALPSEPFKAGGRELTVASRAGGGEEVAGGGTVVLTVPLVPMPDAAPPATGEAGTEGGAHGVVAVLVPARAPPRVLQGGTEAERSGAARGGLTLDRVDYDDKDAVRFTGNAAAGAAVRLYIDDAAAGDALADGGGRWSLTPGLTVLAGVHRVRVDQLDPSGRVVGRVELPFQRDMAERFAGAGAGGAAGGGVGAADRVVVQPGQTLWRLARVAYGRGVRYTVIYLANREQIRDPRLIYPGQTFSMPAGATPAGR